MSATLKFQINDIIYDRSDGEVLKVIGFESSLREDDIILGEVIKPSISQQRTGSYSNNIARAGDDVGFILHPDSIVDRVLNKYNNEP